MDNTLFNRLAHKNADRFQRFGTPQATQPIECLSDNGSAYIDHRTRSFARALGLER